MSSQESESGNFLDNLSMVHMINNSTSGCQYCMKFIRGIVLTSLTYNVRFFVDHVPTKLNVRVDALLRMQMERF